MIGEFVDGTNLEPKAHRCTISEMRARFGLGSRSELCAELERFLECGRRCGFLYALIGGSFATNKPLPGDLDITWFGPPGMDRNNVPAGCAALMEQDRSRERFGHDFMYIPLYEDEASWQEQLDRWGFDLGFDVKTRIIRGTLLLEL